MKRNKQQQAPREDLQAQEHNVALFHHIRDSSGGASSIANMQSPNRGSDTETLNQEYQLQHEVNFVIERAMKEYGKSHERDLSLVEILKQFEHIVEEDANTGESNYDP